MKRLVSLLLLAACGVTPTAASETSGAGGSTSAASNTTASSASIASSTSHASADESSSDAGPCGLFGCEDVGNDAVRCSIWDQSCPPGEKCTPSALEGSPTWNGTRCVPVAEDPGRPGDPCTVDASMTGVDSCDVGSMCWHVDATTGFGFCVPHCTGSETDPTCADPRRRCMVPAEGIVILCHRLCDPRVPTTCEAGLGCYPVDARFVCAPDASREDGALFDACAFINNCDPSLVCVNPALSAMCPPDVGGCCLPVCDTSAPDCPGTMDCEPWYEAGNTPAGYEHVGVCFDELPED